MVKLSVQVVEFLKKTINHLESGWCQNNLRLQDINNHMSYCLIGAMMETYGGDWKHNSPIYGSILVNLKKTLLNTGFVGDPQVKKHILADFNDTPGRTVEEVINLVKLTIKQFETESEI